MDITHGNFMEQCREIAAQYLVNNGYMNDKPDTAKDDVVFVVWRAKVLQNDKCLVSAIGKGIPYFEFTYNGDKNELYMDVYKKIKNESIKC